MIETEEKRRRSTGRYLLGALAFLYVIGVLFCFVAGMRGSGKSDMSMMSSAFWHPSAPE